MRFYRPLLVGLFAAYTCSAVAQKAEEIAPADVPNSVTVTLNAYFAALSAPSMQATTEKLSGLLGGSLLEADGRLRTPIEKFALPKDRAHHTDYQHPVQLVRALTTPGQTDGEGSTEVSGTWYKVWIARKDGNADLAAPFTLIVTEGGTAVICYSVGNL